MWQRVRTRVTAVLSLIAAGAMIGCGAGDGGGPPKTLRLNEVVEEVVPKEFFSGAWRAVNTENGLLMHLDFKKKTLVSILKNEEQIEDLVPVDGGYAVHLFDPVHSDHPNGLHTVVVLKKLDRDSIALIESPDLVTVFQRKTASAP